MKPAKSGAKKRLDIVEQEQIPRHNKVNAKLKINR